MRLLLRSDRFRDVGLSIVLAIQGSIMFVLAPLAATGVLPPMVTDVFRVGLAATAVILLTRSRFVAISIIATFVLSAALTFSARRAGVATAVSLERIAATTAFDVVVGATVAKVAFGQGHVSIHRIMGAVILYLSIALVFSNAYRAAALLLHPSFNGLTSIRSESFGEFLYFSLSTITTTGYGDIVPLHPFVRSLANLEAVVGQLFPATLLASLVTLHSAKRDG